MTRSKTVLSLALALASGVAADAQTVQHPASAERWGVFEIVLTGPSTGNPYVDVVLGATFTQGGVSKSVSGFYDGGGTYRIRFMPHLQGTWSFTTTSNVAGLSGKTGTFSCTAPSAGNRGPVRVRDTFHFRYEDGTPYHQVGTTAYGWTNQPTVRQDETLATLSRNAFNKIRMLVFPKYYVHSTETPPMWPYEGSPHAWNFDRPVYAFFQNYDRRVRQLRDLGIEADVILLNPYDGWGLKNIKNNRTQEERFLKYLIARLSAYRNVWWSMSNEYELWDTNDAYWDRVFQVVRDHDPYGHLRSIHNMHQVYDHSKPWVTHASLQQVGIHMGETRTYRTRYNKPIVWDEVGYEGNIPESWGRLTPQEMTRRFWIGLVDGAYVGHGETYAHPQEIIWWSKGGLLYGQSPARIAFLAQLVRDHVPGQKLEPLGGNNDAAHLDTRCYVFYYDTATATSRSFSMTAGIPYRVYVVDTWNMTKTDAGVRTGSFTVNLPNNPYMAVLLVQDGEPVPPPPPDPNFVKGINFHGSAVTIENNPWSSNAQALASGLSYPAPPNVWTSQIAPVPAVDPDTSAMLNTGIWAQLRNLSFAQTLADGSYDVFFWVLENHQSNFRAFDIRLEGTTVATSVGTMAKGAWRKYGPYRAAVADGDLDVDLIYRFGDPCLMGMAIFRAGATTSPPPTVTVAASDANASEAGTDAGTFTITRSGATTAALAVNVTIGGTASGGSDYASIGASVTLPAGSATAVVRVVPVDDTAVEGAETVALTVAPGAGYAVGTPSSAVVTIADNDASGGGGGGTGGTGAYFKGINFNGSAVTIEGNRWIGYSEALTAGLSFTTAINTWVSQVPPQPAVDADGYGMLNTAVWLPTSFGLRQTIPNGTYQVFFWLLENHQSNFRSFDVRLEGATAAQGIGTLPYGTWSKYGPYSVTVGDGVLSIDLVRNFGDPHLMGLVIQSGGSGGTTTPPPVADPALVLHWRLDETAGTSASDASGNGNAGTLSPQGPVWTDGRIAGGLDFGGGGDRVTAPSSATLNSLKGQMTASLWVYKRSDAPTWGILAGRRYGSGWEDLWNVYYTNSASDEYGFGLRTSAGPAVLTGPSSTADRNLWVHLAAVYDGSRMLLYRNGQEIARRSHTGTIPDEAAPLLVAAGDNGTYGIGEYVDAILDDLRIYNRALSASEIQALAGSSFAMSSQASDADAGVVAAEPSGSEGREGTCGLVGAELLFALAVGAFRPRRRR